MATIGLQELELQRFDGDVGLHLPARRWAPARILACVVAASIAIPAAAAPAAWYKWRSKLNGTVVCAQVMQGEWEKADGPFRDARCEKRGVPGR